MTSNAVPRGAALGDVSAATARAQLVRILASRHFAKADRLRHFLQFVAEEALDGRSEFIKESVIGLAVFHRRASTYDPGTDPIVRVQAGLVRAKLLAYYQQEGIEDLLLIELPLGQYVPTFRVRPKTPSQSLAPSTDASWMGNVAAVSPHRPVLSLQDKPSIAVLPFQNMSGDTEQEYFCEGIVEEIITARREVSRVPRRYGRSRELIADDHRQDN